MRIFFSLVAVFFLAFQSIAQTTPSPGLAFNAAEFTKRFEVVEWLVEYDNVAWRTTDFLLALPKDELSKLGSEWFCFQDKNKRWHAVYGGLIDGKYQVAVHLEMDSKEKITKSTQVVDADFLTKHALALKTGLEKLQSTIPKGSPRFNQYIRQNSDKTFSVWLLPAFQPNRMAAFGGEAVYLIDSAGTRILKDDSYFQKVFRGFMSEPPREIWLDYREMDAPSLGAIFFVWYYKSYFTNIFIDNAKSTSTVVKTGPTYTWVHVVKEGPTKSQPEDLSRPKLERKKP